MMFLNIFIFNFDVVFIVPCVHVINHKSIETLGQSYLKPNKHPFNSQENEILPVFIESRSTFIRITCGNKLKPSLA